MDSPWTTLAATEPNRDYLALLSYLPLNKYRAMPAWLRFTVQIQKQLRETALMDFVAKVPHGQAMRALLPHMGPTKFTRWRVSGSALPLKWEEAMRRWKEGDSA